MQMPSDTNRAPEAPKLSHSEKKDRHESHSEDVDLGVGVDASGILEGVDGAEDGAEAMGNVSEAKEGIGESRQATGGKFQQFQKNLTDEEAEELKKKLLQSPPTSKMMVREVRKKIHNEIVELQKTAREAESKGAYRELTTSVAKIRELRGILGQMFHATAEVIKNIWLKVVYGIV